MAETPRVGSRQHALARMGSTVVQAGRDVIYGGHTGGRRALLTPLRPPVGRNASGPTIRGRDGLIALLEHAVAGDDRASRVHVLHGMGGCGKTTVALEIARRALDLEMPVWWINAATAESLVDSMQALAVALGVDPEVLVTGSLPEIVWARLASQQRRWLLVFDSADDPDEVLGPPTGRVADGNGWLRPAPDCGLVLVTSRDGTAATWGGERALWMHRHHVRPLENADGGAFLTDLAGSAAGSPAEAEALSVRLGGLPLALRIAGSYLAETAAIPALLADPDTVRTFDEYRDAVERGDACALFAAGEGEITEPLARALVGQTWELSLNLLAEHGMSEARALLRLLSCFALAPIPYALILNTSVLVHPLEP